MFDANDWYWKITDTASVFSSKTFSSVPETDEEYLAWVGAGNVPTEISSSDMETKKAEIMLARPVHVTFASAPESSGLYSITSESIANINAVATYVLLKGSFPLGATSFPWSGADGQIHLFASVDHFKDFAVAIADYVAGLSLYANSAGTHGVLPATNEIQVA